MIATIIKSTLLGLTLGIALAYAAEPEIKRVAGEYRRASDGATRPQSPAPAVTVTLPSLPLVAVEISR